MANPTQSSSSTPDWLAAVKAEAALADPERIPLRSSAPVPRGPGKDEMEPSEKKPAETRRLAVMDNELIDVKKAGDAKRVVAPSKPLAPRSITTTPPPAPKVKADGDIDRPRYPSRLMFPSTALMASIGTAWVMYVMPWLPVKFHSTEVLVSIPGAFLLFQLVKWAYRILGCGYRLTKTQLIQFAPGPLPDPEPIDITTIASITVQQSIYEWWMLAGSLKLTFERDSHKDVVLGPVSWPKRRMRLMQQAIDAARDGKVIAGRVAA